MLKQIYSPDKIMKKVILLLFLPTLFFAQSIHKDFLTDQKSKLLIQNNKFAQSEKVFVKKKTGLAIIYSLLLPGMGELYAGSYESGKYFTIADGLFWGALVGFNVYGNWQENNYKEFAKSFGNANINGKKDKFFADMANYLDIEQYNHAMELNRRFSEVYNESTHYWKWRDQTQRKEYRTMWLASENAYNNIRFAIGALILNRLASAINAVRLVVKHNKKMKNNDLSWNFSFGMERLTQEHSLLKLNIVKSF